MIIIVGGGLFGCTAAALAEKHGAEVVILDSKEPYAASPASACLFKPSWLTKLDKNQVTKGYEILDELFGVKTIRFTDTKIDWVPPEKILRRKKLLDRAVEVKDGYVRTAGGLEFHGKVLVAVGAASEPLVSMPPVRGMSGVSFYQEGTVEPQIKVWAPYRQAMVFNIAPNKIWVGDGTAIISKNWQDEKADVSEERLKKLFSLTGKFKACIGIRPYIPSHPQGLFQKVYKSTWVSNGGAKKGTLLAAYQAWKFCEEAL